MLPHFFSTNSLFNPYHSADLLITNSNDLHWVLIPASYTKQLFRVRACDCPSCVLSNSMTSTLWVPLLLTWEVLPWTYVHTCPWNPLLSCLLGALICSSLNPHCPYCEPNPELLSSVFHLAPPATATPLCPSHLLYPDSGPSPVTKLVSLLSSKPQMGSGLYSFAPLQTRQRRLTLSFQCFLFPSFS